MKIERINENQIRCTLTSFDLSARNINIVELAYGTEKAKKLFREMIQRASNEVGFEAEDIPLMVEAIPLSSESIMLVITKIEDPEELDTRFARFSPAAEETQEEILPDPAGEFLEGAGDLGRLLSQHMADMTDSPQVPADSETASTKQIGKPLRIFLFIKSPEHASIIWYWIAGIQMNTVSQEYATYWQNMAKNWPEILQVKPTLRNIMKPSSGRMRLKSCSSSDNSL